MPSPVDRNSGARRGRATVVLAVVAVVICVLPWLLGGPWWGGPLILAGTAVAWALTWLAMCWVYDEWPGRGDR